MAGHGQAHGSMVRSEDHRGVVGAVSSVVLRRCLLVSWWEFVVVLRILVLFRAAVSGP